MNTSIGFVILSHSDPPQLKRLVGALIRTYDDPGIVVHHDFGQCGLSSDDFPQEVTFVQPYLRTQWAHISVVHAFLVALRELYNRHRPDWFILLSGSDY